MLSTQITRKAYQGYKVNPKKWITSEKRRCKHYGEDSCVTKMFSHEKYLS